jgi:hypothetical protein
MLPLGTYVTHVLTAMTYELYSPSVRIARASCLALGLPSLSTTTTLVRGVYTCSNKPCQHAQVKGAVPGRSGTKQMCARISFAGARQPKQGLRTCLRFATSAACTAVVSSSRVTARPLSNLESMEDTWSWANDTGRATALNLRQQTSTPKHRK